MSSSTKYMAKSLKNFYIYSQNSSYAEILRATFEFGRCTVLMVWSRVPEFCTSSVCLLL